MTPSRLGEHALLISGQHIDSALSNTEGRGVPYLTGPADFTAGEARATRYTTRPLIMCEAGDVLVTVKGSGCGKVAVVPMAACISRQLMAVRPLVGDGRFWLYLLLAQQYDLERMADGSAIPGLSRSQILGLQVPCFDEVEQQRIADVLDTADKVIGQTEALIVKLKQMKEGLLHDLLTRGLDENGELRDPVAHPEQFKDSPLGRIPCAWEVSNVEAEFDLTTGFTLGAHRVPRSHPRGYLRVANVHRDEVRLEDVAQLEASDVELVGRTLQIDDLLIVEGHANPNEIARCARVPARAVGLTFQNHLFRLQSRRMQPVFACAWFNGDYARRYWRRMTATSSGLYTINSRMLMSLLLAVPQAAEQTKIVDRILTHESKIQAEEAYRDKLRLLKKGLMQDLLTGRVRVPVPEGASEAAEIALEESVPVA